MSAGRKINTKSLEWGTPPKYVNLINEFFDNQIELDPCSNQYSIVNAKTKFILPTDGLLMDWNEYKKIFVNPPYGIDKERKTKISNWLEKCYLTSQSNSEIIALIPVATNTKHWKNFIFGKTTICFLYDTRLKFLENGNENTKGAPMSCALIYWGNNIDKFKKTFNHVGYITN